MRTFIIAEAGSCHDGSLEKAIALIDVAKNGGADAVKFQFWSNAKRLAERRRALDYLPVYDRYQMPRNWLTMLRHECDRRAIEFMCTTYLPEDIDVVEPFVRRFKVASFEAADEMFVNAHRGRGKEIIVSVGMRAPIPLGVTVLHCVSAYPAPYIQANLRVLHNREIDGFSDHTHHLLTGAFAVCAGAKVLEVHIRDWITATDNPDFRTALDPCEFAEYVQNVRLAEDIMGDGRRVVQPSEEPMVAYRVRS